MHEGSLEWKRLLKDSGQGVRISLSRLGILKDAGTRTLKTAY